MLDIMKVDHVGIRISDKAVSIAFYAGLGFELLGDVGFEKGHPIIMQHPSGVVLNLLGPTTAKAGENILMDEEQKYPGITHFALRVKSVEKAEAFVTGRDIAITGRMNFKGMSAIFIRDPDRNVIELDSYGGDEPETRKNVEEEQESIGYADHP